jgi:hypothetical protein
MVGNRHTQILFAFEVMKERTLGHLRGLTEVINGSLGEAFRAD